MFSRLWPNNSSTLDSKGNEKSTSHGNEHKHYVIGENLLGPFPSHVKRVMVGMGCFWGAERMFWSLDGICMTAVGFSGGKVPNPSYEQVCYSETGHNEVVLIHFNPKKITLMKILKVFWEGHDPTQGMRQGNDIGSQYRSGIYVYGQNDLNLAIDMKLEYEKKLLASGRNKVTTEIILANDFYYAEEYHQQYLAKNPNGYCGIGGTGILY